MSKTVQIISLSQFKEIEKTVALIPVPIQLSNDRIILMPNGNQTAEAYLQNNHPELLTDYRTARDERKGRLNYLCGSFLK